MKFKSKRMLIKLSGEMLSAPGKTLDYDKIDAVAAVLKRIAEKGMQIGIVVGGGNIMRGRSSGDMNRTDADNMGMLATVINGIALKDGDRAITPSEDVTLRIPLPDGYSPERTRLYFIDESGNITEADASPTDGVFELITDTLGTYAVIESGSDRLPGDINEDGTVDLKDVTILRRFVAEWEGVTISAANSDVDGDGEIDLKDVTVLRRYVAEWEGVVLV